jgi:hypothetical protein
VLSVEDSLSGLSEEILHVNHPFRVSHSRLDGTRATDVGLTSSITRQGSPVQMGIDRWMSGIRTFGPATAIQLNKTWIWAWMMFVVWLTLAAPRS